jgi:hypothetical protein
MSQPAISLAEINLFCLQHLKMHSRGHLATRLFRKVSIRALSAHSAAEFNISPGRWQHVWLVAIVPPERWEKMDRNDCHTAWGNLKTLISSLYHYKNNAWLFSL